MEGTAKYAKGKIAPTVVADSNGMRAPVRSAHLPANGPMTIRAK